MPTAFWVALILQAAISGLLAMDLADKKGYSPGGWFTCGFLFGILGLIAAAGLPVREAAEPASRFLKKCPFCAELVKNEAIVCRYCGRDLPAPGRPQRQTKQALSAPVMEAAELVRKYKSGDRDFGLANLIGIQLRGVNLPGVNLAGADLSRADLYEANLTKAVLTDANLSGANLFNAILSKADLSGANLAMAHPPTPQAPGPHRAVLGKSCRSGGGEPPKDEEE